MPEGRLPIIEDVLTTSDASDGHRDDRLCCATCGAENPGKAKLCLQCAAPLAAPAAAESS